MSETAGLWPPAQPCSVVLVIRGEADERRCRLVVDELAAVLRRQDVAIVSCETAEAAPIDLRLVNLLARVALAARRRGVAVRVRQPARVLVELLELSGLGQLADVPRPLSL